MDLARYRVEKQQIASISDPEARQKDLSRIEGEYHLSLALNHLYFSRTGKLPEQGVLSRLVSAVHTLSAESYLERDGKVPEKEVALRLESARKTLISEL